MSEETAVGAGTAEQAGNDGAGQPEGGARMFSQDELNDRIASTRKAERARYAEFKQKADGYDALAAEVEGLREKAGGYDELKAERDRLKAEGERRALVRKVAGDLGLAEGTVEMLSGKTEEELSEQARKLAKAVSAPVASEGGKPAGVAPSAREDFVNSLFG